MVEMSFRAAKHAPGESEVRRVGASHRLLGNARMTGISRLNIRFFVLLMCMSGCKRDRAVGGFYPRIQIGPDATMQPQGERSLYQPPLPSFFHYFKGATSASATHFVRASQSAPAHIAFYLEGDLETGRQLSYCGATSATSRLRRPASTIDPSMSTSTR